MSLYLVGLLDMDRVFPLVADFMASSYKTFGNVAPHDLYRMCCTRQAFMFVDVLETPRNAVVCALETRGGETVLNVIAMGGKGGENWKSMFAEICDFGKRFGASRTRFNGRKGWQKVLPQARVVGFIYEVEN